MQGAFQLPQAIQNSTFLLTLRMEGASWYRFIDPQSNRFGVNSCCVDEVAAQHVNADALVHYGHACMTLSVLRYLVYTKSADNFALQDVTTPSHLCFWSETFPRLR